ncbi:MAG: hypothetical protein CME24_03525 [Gemmatimonadetes bacterium]|nr:hypothetical protein [Gemmatimonadota bacterium]
MNPSFEKEWRAKVKAVRASAFWQYVSAPPTTRISPARSRPRSGEVAVDSTWSLCLEGDFAANGPAQAGFDDLRQFLRLRLGLRLRIRSGSPGSRPSVGPTLTGHQGPTVQLRLRQSKESANRWCRQFHLDVRRDGITVTAPNEPALLRACLWLSNYWSLRRNAHLKLGRRTVKAAVELHTGADLWGGFSTTQAWPFGRETDDNFIELARVGLTATPVMTVLEDYLLPTGGPFDHLAHPQAKQNRRRLQRLARATARRGVHVMLMGYNPKLAPDDPIFRRRPRFRGALQARGAFRTLCTSDPATRRFLADSWASLFEQIPELGGIIAITGGEGFYHCFMRSTTQAADCPRCGKRHGPEVVAEFVNDVARRVRQVQPEARLVTWPYSAGHWSGDRDQDDYIAALDPKHVIFQTEIDKDSVDWREAGYAKDCWDYSMSKVTVSERCRRQRQLCREAGLPFSTKLEINTSIECLNVPYLPALENQRAIWTNARSLKPAAIHSRWMFDGACKSASEEVGYWSIWGKGTEYADLDQTLEAIAERDFGSRRAAKSVRRAWSDFSEGLRHHPQLDYYKGSFFIGPGQPLVLDAASATQPDQTPSKLDPAFFGAFYWHWENSVSDDAQFLVQQDPLFYYRPAFRAIARRGPNRGHDVALDELQEQARLWERGLMSLERAGKHVPRHCRARYRRELDLSRWLAWTWRSAARVEEFLRLRDTIGEFSARRWVRSGHLTENLRDLEQMTLLAQQELEMTRSALKLICVRGEALDFLDLRLRLDMGTASTPQILTAKIAQLERLLTEQLPAWRNELQVW